MELHALSIAANGFFIGEILLLKVHQNSKKKMGILNQSIHPNPHTLLPSKTQRAEDACQNLPKMQSFQESQSMKKLFQQPNPMKKASLKVVSANPVQSETTCTISEIGLKMDEDLSMSVMSSFAQNEKFVEINDEMSELDHYGPNIALTVSVSSAVKLDSRQIELIVRKMQRLTGFRDLRIENVVDSSLIAGFIISYGDGESHAIDLSVKGQLAALVDRVEISDKYTL